jgi:hypothetical protein
MGLQAGIREGGCSSRNRWKAGHGRLTPHVDKRAPGVRVDVWHHLLPTYGLGNSRSFPAFHDPATVVHDD